MGHGAPKCPNDGLMMQMTGKEEFSIILIWFRHCDPLLLSHVSDNSLDNCFVPPVCVANVWACLYSMCRCHKFHHHIIGNHYSDSTFNCRVAGHLRIIDREKAEDHVEGEELKRLAAQYEMEWKQLEKIRQNEAKVLMSDNLRQIQDVHRMKDIQKQQEDVSVNTFYPSALRAGGALSSRSGWAAARLQNPYLCNRLTDFLHLKWIV